MTVGGMGFIPERLLMMMMMMMTVGGMGFIPERLLMMMMMTLYSTPKSRLNNNNNRRLATLAQTNKLKLKY